jgi:protein-tyrosine phosphatase
MRSMDAIEIRLEGAPNFRDLGGVRAADGRSLRRHRIYRSEILSQPTEGDLQILRRLQIAAVCDLRRGIERTRQANRLPRECQPRILGLPPGEGMEAVQPDGVQGRLAAADFDPAEAKAVLVAGYRPMPRVLAPSLDAVFRHLVDSDGAPLLIHCTSGKDRSGFVCAMLLSALAITREEIFRDYLLSRERYPLENIRRMLLGALGDMLPPGRMEVLLQLATANFYYLAAAFDQVDSEYGGVDEYLHHAAGLDAARRGALQAALLI